MKIVSNPYSKAFREKNSSSLMSTSPQTSPQSSVPLWMPFCYIPFWMPPHHLLPDLKPLPEAELDQAPQGTIPPVNLDHHPGRLGRHISGPYDINPFMPCHTVSQYHFSCHSYDPAFFDCSFPSEQDLGTGYPSGQLDPEGVDGPQSKSVVSGGAGDDPILAHRSLYNDPEYVYMHSAVSHIPDVQFPAPTYDVVPLSTIDEVERPTPYENHPLPRELQGTFQPKYENVERLNSDLISFLLHSI